MRCDAIVRSPFFVGLACCAMAAQAVESPQGQAGINMKPDAVGAKLGRSFISTAPEPTETSSGACVVFRKTLDLPEVPKNATLNLFADARYVLWINGRYVGGGPARFEPAAPEYDPIPIARYLRKGRNVIAVLVVGRVGNGKTRWRPLGMTANVVSGSRILARTDSSWRWSSETRYRKVLFDWANLYDIADARLEDGDWTRTEYDDAKWSHAFPVSANPAPLRPTTIVDGRELALDVRPIGPSWWGPLTKRRTPLLTETPVEPKWDAAFPVTLHAGESLRFQFPHLVLATTSFEADADDGSEIKFGYMSQGGYTCRAGNQTFTTTDTRSIYEGTIQVLRGRVTFKKIEFSERLYPFTRVGSFHSGDPLLDRLWTTCVRGLEVTSEDAYIDCADRERVEWMDTDPPAFDVTRVAMAGPAVAGRPAYADPRLLESMIRRTALTLQPEGWVKAHTCSDRFDIHAKMEDRACDWVEGVRRYVDSSGKTDVVREIWPAIVRQMDYFLSHRTERGLVQGREWTVWGNPVGYQTCEGTTLNAFVCRALLDAAYLGRKIGKTQDAIRFEAAAKALSEAIDRVLWNEEAGTYDAGYYVEDVAKAAPDFRPLNLKVTDGRIEPTRHAALFMLDQRLVPPNRVARTTAYLMAHPPTENEIMQYYYFWKQLYALDREQADRQVLAKMRAEWKDMAESPYEATFEGLHAPGVAHCYGMFPAYFLSAYVLGVRPEGKAILIEPRLADLSHASGTVVTEKGPVAVEWSRNESGGSFMFDAPSGADVILRLPAGSSSAKASLVGTPSAAFRPRGRWLEIRLRGGRYSGAWTL